MKKEISIFKVVMLIVYGTLINVIGKAIAAHFGWPLWLDSLGTVLVAYVLGSYPGAIVGLAGNLIYGIFTDGVIIYGITSVAIGLIVGISTKKGRLQSIFGVMLTSTIVAVASILISTPLNILLYDGATGNVWGDGVSCFFIERGLHPLISYFLGEFYLDFADKVLTLGILFECIKIYYFFIKKINGADDAEKTMERHREFSNAKKTVGMFLAIIIPLSMLAVAIDVRADEGDTALVSAETDEDSDTAPDDDTEAGQIVSKVDEMYSYVQTVYSSKNGLSCGEANDIAGTPDGVLWVGTYAGLYRYNGRSFTLMDYDSVKNVNCLYIDKEGRMWIGTNDNGLSLCINEKISNVLDRSNGLPSNSVRSIVLSSDGYYYVGTSDSLQIIELNNGLQILDTISDVNYAYDLSADKNGNVAAVTYSGDLYLLNNCEIVNHMEPDSKHGIHMCSYFDEDGLLYVAYSDSVVIVYDISGGNFEKIDEYDFSNLAGINKLYMASNGTIYACGEKGIGYIRADKTTGKVYPTNFQSSIDSMTEDYQGNLWFASSRIGLLRLSKSPFYDFYGAAGRTANVVNAVTKWNGNIYAGTDSGIDCFNEDSGIFIDDEITKEFEGLRIRCVYTDTSENLWICTYGRGLFCIDKNGILTEYSQENGKFCDWVRVVMEMSDGTIVSAGDAGLIFIKDKKIVSSLSMDELGISAIILNLCEGIDGSLLIGTDGDGIVCCSDGEVTKVIDEDNGLSSGVVLRIKKTSTGNGYFIITSNGISYMNVVGQITNISDFPYSNNYDLEIESGNVYVLGSAGIYIVKESELISANNINDYVLLDSSRGLEFSLTVNAHNYMSDDGMLYLPGDTGVYRLNLYDFGSMQKSYRMKMSYINVDGVDYPVERGTDIVIPRDSVRVTLYPEIINYTLEDPTIMYTMQGVDGTYISVPLSEFSAISYTGLHTGENVFTLYVLSSSGEILEESTYVIYKEAAFWDNKEFYIYLYVLTGLTIIWFTWLIARMAFRHTLEIKQKELNIAKQQVQMGNETIMAIARTVDAKDENTSQHSQRVSDYSELIAIEMGLSADECENLRKAALLHDIGKIGIPDSILNKPARLNDDEYEIMKTHVTRGAEILKDFTMVERAAEGAKYHHERFDGTGYPEGLKGYKIPLYGRIIGVADAFDAMTQNRVYRKRLTVDFALNELKKCSGTQFDPDIADIMIKLVKKETITIDKNGNVIINKDGADK